MSANSARTAPKTKRGQGLHTEKQPLDLALLHQPAEWPCFPSAWHLAAWRAEAGHQLLPCADCLPEYKTKMVRTGRCRRPEIVFLVEAGEIVGRVPTDRDASRFVVLLATRVLGIEATSILISISHASLPHYRNGNRVLPSLKLQMLRSAVRAAVRILIRI